MKNRGHFITLFYFYAFDSWFKPIEIMSSVGK